jgi:ribonuclease J
MGRVQVRIHRGCNEVGGSCIELASRGERLVLDLGRPIWVKRDDVVPLPDVAGLEQPDASLRAVVISHPHLDHYGLAGDIAAPIILGEAAWRILAEASFFTGGVLPATPTRFLRHREPIEIGPFTITPYLNDHSAFDAYSMLIEADGRRLFYSGDIRGHGRKRGIFEQLLRDPPRVDALLMEGTNVREGVDVDARGPSERDVEASIAALARGTPGLVLAAFSPQNIDRLVTVFRSAIKSGRELVLDLYGATIATATRLATIPQASWDRVRVYLPRSQRARVIKQGEFARTNAVRASRIYPEELRARAGELIMLFRGSMARELAAAECLDGAHLAWSMWPGYLRDESGVALQEFLTERAIPMSVHHSSGHAFVPDLRRLVDALEPDRVVPIHSFAGDRFGDLFPRVDRRQDGEWWAV